VEKNQYELCHEVLKRFSENGILDSMILIGSWCVYFYQDYFSDVPYVNQIVLKTRDMDVLIPNPRKLRSSTDIPSLIKDLGYVVSFDQITGHMKLDHPELILEFLVPNIGRGSDVPANIKELNINAFPIRYTHILEQDVIHVEFDGIPCNIPHPVNFALQKLLICVRRKDREKAKKDKNTAIQILHFVIQKKEERKIKSVFEQLGNKQKSIIVRELEKENESEIINILYST